MSKQWQSDKHPWYARHSIAILSIVAVFFTTSVAYYTYQRVRVDFEKQQDKIGLSIASHQDFAFRALSEGRYADAEAEATKGLLLRNDVLCLLWRACARQQVGKEKEALEDTEAAMAAVEKSEVSKEQQAQLYILAAKLVKAQADRIESNFELDAARPTYDRAAAYCRRAIDLVPDNKTAADILKNLPN